MSGAGHDKPQPGMAEAAYYRIRVRGRLDPNDASRLRGLSVGAAEDDSGAAVTTLEGQLPDQAALLGVLHALNTYHLPLLSVEFRPEGEETLRSLCEPEEAARLAAQLTDSKRARKTD